MNNSLINLSTQLVTLAYDSEGEVTDEMEKFTAAIEDKIDAYGWLLDEIPHHVAAAKERIDALRAVVKRFEHIEESLKFRLKASMSTLGTNELAGNDYKFKLQKCKQSLVLKEEVLPRDYFKVLYVPDKDRIREDLDRGIEIPGVLLEGGVALRKYVLAGRGAKLLSP